MSAVQNYIRYNTPLKGLALYMNETRVDQLIHDLFDGQDPKGYSSRSHREMKRHGLAWYLGLYDVQKKKLADIIAFRYENKVLFEMQEYVKLETVCQTYGLINTGRDFYHLALNDVWFDHIQSGRKIYEGRVGTHATRPISNGDIIEFIRKSDGSLLYCMVEANAGFASYRSALTQLGLPHVLPGITTIDEGVAVYRQWNSEAEEKRFGVTMLKIVLLKPPVIQEEPEEHEVWEAEYKKVE